MGADAAAPPPVYRRIVLKLSGEALAGDQGYGIAPAGFEAIFDTPSRLTDVPEEYLPPECRR